MIWTNFMCLVITYILKSSNYFYSNSSSSSSGGATSSNAATSSVSSNMALPTHPLPAQTLSLPASKPPASVLKTAASSTPSASAVVSNAGGYNLQLDNSTSTSSSSKHIYFWYILYEIYYINICTALCLTRIYLVQNVITERILRSRVTERSTAFATEANL